MPGKFFDAKTTKILAARIKIRNSEAFVTIKRLRGDGFDVHNLRSARVYEPNLSHSHEPRHLLAHLE